MGAASHTHLFLAGQAVTAYPTGDPVNGVSLALIDGTLKISVGESTAFYLSVDTTLNLPAMGANSAPSTLNLSGSLSFSLTNESIDASLTLTAGGTTGTWQPAFGIPGLSLVNLTVQGGVSFGGPIPLPNLGFAATVNALPGPAPTCSAISRARRSPWPSTSTPTRRRWICRLAALAAPWSSSPWRRRAAPR